MSETVFVGISSIRRNGKHPFAEVVIQPPYGEAKNTRSLLVKIEIPIRSINITTEEQAELEELIRSCVDIDALRSWAAKISDEVSTPTPS